MTLRLNREIEIEQRQLRRDDAARAEARRRALALNQPTATPVAVEDALREHAVLAPDASEEERELAELEDVDIAHKRRQARIAELRPIVVTQRRAPRLHAVRELFAQRADLVKQALQPLEVREPATRVTDILAACAINNDCTPLLEALPALVSEALGENVARLRGRLFADNIQLAETRFAIEGKRNPHVRPPVIERSWDALLAIARGET